MKSVIFKNCNLLDVENSNVISGIDVLTEDNLITKISESSIKSKNSIWNRCSNLIYIILFFYWISFKLFI